MGRNSPFAMPSRSTSIGTDASAMTIAPMALFPHCSALEGSRYPLRELRPKRGDSPLRPIYGFDPKREALLLLGGDKSDDKRFYERITPKVERLWEDHLADLADEDANEEDDEKGR